LQELSWISESYNNILSGVSMLKNAESGVLMANLSICPPVRHTLV